MGKPGPRPTPTVTLQKRDSWRGELNKDEPEPEVGLPSCPSWLSKYAKTTWKEIGGQLEQMGLMTKIDRNALARYCELWASFKKATEFLQKEGHYFKEVNQSGKLLRWKVNPQIALRASISEQMLKLEREFGLTPSARSRITVPENGKKHIKDKEKEKVKVKILKVS